MNERELRTEKFYMSLFIASYVGLFVSLFFWEMAACSLISKLTGISFRVLLVLCTLVSAATYAFRSRIITLVDGFTLTGMAAAAISSFFMGGGSGAWLRESHFLIDLGIFTALCLVLNVIVFVHSAKNFVPPDTGEGPDDDDPGSSEP